MQPCWDSVLYNLSATLRNSFNMFSIHSSVNKILFTAFTFSLTLTLISTLRSSFQKNFLLIFLPNSWFTLYYYVPTSFLFFFFTLPIIPFSNDSFNNNIHLFLFTISFWFNSLLTTWHFYTTCTPRVIPNISLSTGNAPSTSSCHATEATLQLTSYTFYTHSSPVTNLYSLFLLNFLRLPYYITPPIESCLKQSRDQSLHSISLDDPWCESSEKAFIPTRLSNCIHSYTGWRKPNDNILKGHGLAWVGGGCSFHPRICSLRPFSGIR